MRPVGDLAERAAFSWSYPRHKVRSGRDLSMRRKLGGQRNCLRTQNDFRDRDDVLGAVPCSIAAHRHLIPWL